MASKNNFRVTLYSAEATEALGRAVGARLHGGETIELSSDLGGGKTTFVRGLAEGAGSTDHVASPTFTLSKVYQAGRFEIHHFDFYRLGEAGIMRDELKELLEDPNVTVAVEWSDIVQAVLPDERLTISIKRSKLGQDIRQLTLEYPDSLQYLVEGVAVPDTSKAPGRIL